MARPHRVRAPRHAQHDRATPYIRCVRAQAWEKYQAMPKRPKAKFRNFYKGGFKDDMDRREAALILGVRYGCARGCR